jgi:hypothetical protein
VSPKLLLANILLYGFAAARVATLRLALTGRVEVTGLKPTPAHKTGLRLPAALRKRAQFGQ